MIYLGKFSYYTFIKKFEIHICTMFSYGNICVRNLYLIHFQKRIFKREKDSKYVSEPERGYEHNTLRTDPPDSG